MLEKVPDIAQIAHGIRNIFADIRNVPTAVFCVSNWNIALGVVGSYAQGV